MGSIKYFGTDGIRGRVGVKPISPDWVLHLGWAVGKALKREDDSPGKVLIGKDTRISGYMLESALEAGLSAAGMDIVLLGPLPTPGIAYLTRTLRADLGIVISASHNLYYDNGIKFFSADGYKLSDEYEQLIERLIDTPIVSVDSLHLGKASRLQDAQGRYIEFCKSTFPARLNLKGINIVLDCANGAAYSVAPSVFHELGAEVKVIAAQPTGFNINENCGSTCPDNLIQAVLENNADLGIALDGDGDRVMFVDAKGNVIDGDEILYVIAKWYLQTGMLAGGVVGTVMSNLGLEIALHALEIPFYRTKVGDRHILQALQQRGWNLGGENSGHIICLDANTSGDAIVSALKVLAAMVATGKDIRNLLEGMNKTPQVMLNIPYKVATSGIIERPEVKALINKYQKQLGNKARILLRQSGTEPVIRIMVQGDEKVKIQAIANDIALKVKELIE